MQFTVFAAAAFLATAVSAVPITKGSCDKTQLPCGSTDPQNYTIVSGDTLTTIAQKYNSGICDIASYNNITNVDLIFAGENLIIPANCKTPDNTSCLKSALTETGTQTCVKGLSVNPPQYEVIPNDTFTLIANNFDLTLAALEADNEGRFASFDSINVGDKVDIPVCTGCSCTNKSYTIKSGDTFSAIATSNGITIGQIEAANPGQIPEDLQIGQVINVPVCSCVA